MKILFSIIAVVIVGAIGFVLFSDNTEQTAVVNDVATVETPAEESSDENLVEDTEEVVVVDDTEEDVNSETGTETASAEHVFTLDSFGFGYSETELRVKEGDTVTINLTNSAGLHDWVIDEFDAATERIQKGETTSVTFVANKSGTFEYYCSVGNHRAQGMVGTLIVE